MAKIDTLKEILQGMKGILIAFSGGVDSSLLLKVAYDVLGDKAVAVTAVSETYPAHELASAKNVAALVGAKHIIIETSELTIPEFKNNPPDRCYYCKSELFGKLKKMAVELGLAALVDGSNADDDNDFRPGMRACQELGVRSPLKEAGLTKAEIRELSRKMGLPTWDLPSFACLSSRFPYGVAITPEAVVRVDHGETYLRELGFKQLRLRDHGTMARIEVLPADFELVLAHREQITAKLKELGYQYITLDLQGYRTGSMNEVLSETTRSNVLAGK